MFHIDERQATGFPGVPGRRTSQILHCGTSYSSNTPSLPVREFVYGPKVRRGQVILSGLDLALTKYFAGNCEQDPWPTKY